MLLALHSNVDENTPEAPIASETERQRDGEIEREKVAEREADRCVEYRSEGA